MDLAIRTAGRALGGVGIGQALQAVEVVPAGIAGEGVDETLDPAYTYAFEGAIIISRMHAGRFDIQKLIKILKI